MLLVLAIIGYFIFHLIRLESLPVFADESIYIRWAQLILDDAQRYWLFAMNDGKTPLFVWLMVPFLKLFENQLLAGRFASVFIGLLQTGVIGLLVWKLTKNSFTTAWSMVMASVLPFWYFYQRMALMDTLLTFWLSVSLLLSMEISANVSKLTATMRHRALLVIGLAAVLFLAIWTKLPAVLFLLSLVPFGLVPKQKTTKQYFWVCALLCIAIVLTLIFFLSTSILPAFSQLFTRGGDFLFSVSDLIHGSWKIMFFNSGLTIQSLLYYLGPLIVISPIIGILIGERRREQGLLFAATLCFLLPMILMAKVYYPRYILPVCIFFTLSSSLVVETILIRIKKVSFKKSVILALGLALYCANTLAYAGQWDYQAILHPDSLPLVKVDRVQYLEEWSSGHGIAETVRLLQDVSSSKRIAVATEGYFGTLPDGLLLYFHNQDVTNLSIDGIGQPVWNIPQWFTEKTQEADLRWLVVNSHRMRFQLPATKLVSEYCRPNHAPCLQIWDITEYTKMSGK